MVKLKNDDILLEKRWEYLHQFLSKKFSSGEKINMEGILYLIGLQELGQIDKRFKKDDNMNLMHIGICKVLSYFGYYEFDYYDSDGWPHFKLKQKIHLFFKKKGYKIIYYFCSYD